MSEAFLGEIRIVSFAFPPRDWALCSGQLLPINQNQALFSLLGTTYGGDGRTTFALPDYRGRLPVGAGGGPGLTFRTLGETGGEDAVTLTTSDLPAHSHAALASTAPGNAYAPANALLAAGATNFGTTGSPAPFGPALDAAGLSVPHENRQPYLKVNFVICMLGVFPPRT